MILVVLQLCFWASIIGIAHTYVLYPALLRLLATNKTNNTQIFDNNNLPPIVLLMAVYNEQTVIAQKLQSILQSQYPTHLWQLYIGSDGSTDQTNAIVEQYAAQHPNIHLLHFGGRNGKPRIINQLVEQLKSQLPPNAILVLTDANVLFTPNTLPQLCKHFLNPQIGMVGSNILNTALQQQGISLQEQAYIQRENYIKYLEGVIWGCTMGTFGGCFAIRATCFGAVPNNFIVDDFYLTMRVFEQQKQAIQEPMAICYEDVSDDINQEFKRKKRISAGNFQNLMRFKQLLFSTQPRGVAFCFWSHKVLRWLTPFLLITVFLCNAILAIQNYFYASLFVIQVAVLLLPFADLILNKLHVHFKLLRFVRYFYMMNIALLVGFFNYIKGIKTNVWEPTKRNQLPT